MSSKNFEALKKGFCLSLLTVCMLFAATSALAEEKIKVGLVMGYGGIGDMSFNDMQYYGLIRAAQKYSIEIDYKVPKTETEQAMEEALDELMAAPPKLVFLAGYHPSLILRDYAAKHKDVHFVLLDNPMSGVENVSSVVYSQHEGSFVVGYLAAKMSKSKHVGFIGGVDIPVIKAFLKGYEEGAAYADPDVKISVEFCSKQPDYSGFNNPKGGNELAKRMYDSGIDVIYSVASASGVGIIEAAKEKEQFVIGVDSNQDHLAEGFVLTSMMKRLDSSIVDLVGLYLDGELKGGEVYTYGYNNKGVGITDMQYTRDKIGPELIQELHDIEAKIASGEITVTNIHTE